MPAAAQIMASRSAHTDEREEMEGEVVHEREGNGGSERKREKGGRWGLRGEADCMCSQVRERGY